MPTQQQDSDTRLTAQNYKRPSRPQENGEEQTQLHDNETRLGAQNLREVVTNTRAKQRDIESNENNLGAMQTQ